MEGHDEGGLRAKVCVTLTSMKEKPNSDLEL